MDKYKPGICLVIILIGLVVLAYPEENNTMMIKFSETHGPSRLDLAGIFIIMIGYIPLIFKILKSTEMLRKRFGYFLWFMHFLLFITFLLMGLALYTGKDMLLWISIAVSAGLQSMLIYYSFKLDPPKGRM